jgi:hypothetical protein
VEKTEKINKMGRKFAQIDESKLEGMCLFDASLRVCAAELKVSEDAIEHYIRRKYDKTFGEYKSIHTGRMALKLKQKMINKALGGDNACLIFSLKNLSEWKDNPDIVDAGNIQIIVKTNKDEDRS